MQKGKLGSVVAGILAIFLVIICLFYLSFTVVQNRYENKAVEYAIAQSKDTTKSSKAYNEAYKKYIDDISNKPVWLGYTYKEVQKLAIGLGLDLKGGMEVTLQLSVPDILTSMAGDNATAPAFRQAVSRVDSVALAKKTDDLVSVFIEEYENTPGAGDLSVVFADVAKGKSGSIESIIRDEVKDRVSSSVEVLRNRIDQFGVVSPNIQQLEKDGQIMLELPGVKDHERMEELLKTSANLEFYLPMPVNDYRRQLNEFDNRVKRMEGMNNRGLMDHFVSVYGDNGSVFGVAVKTEMDSISNLLAMGKEMGLLPADVHYAWSVKPKESTQAGDIYELYTLREVNGEASMSGDVVKQASVEYDKNQGGTYISMTMNDAAAQQWASLTGANIGKQVSVVLDDKVYSSPVIQNKISGGRTSITGHFTPDEAKDLVNVLKSGKMDAEVKIESSTIIGPSLGQQAIHDGIWSFIVALVLLMIFMCAFYGLIPGLIANLGLVFNIFFTFGILASFQAVLTLPGIAGIVLALGMAVDANVLIFERTKEELRAGKNLRTAIADGYSNAFSAIFDSNLTSIITAIILMAFGSGSIKGFATTLIIGIVCSFFTAVYLTRLVFIAFDKTKPFQRLTFDTKLSRKMFTNTHINFLGKRKVAFGIVAAVVLVVVGSFAIRGLSQGIDFSGGRNYVVQFDKEVNTTEIQAKLAQQFEGASVSVITIDNPTKVRVSTNYKIGREFDNENVDSLISRKLFEVFNDEAEFNKYYKERFASFDNFNTTNEDSGIISSQKVGPSMANDMRNKAYVAVALALVAMFLYILVRFRNVAFSIGALAAVAFTAFTIIGLYSLLYGILPFAMEIDQTFIAAILTVIGYQINDTVVVFDRVRENIGLYPKQDFFTTVNTSINSTLGRTVMTSASTLLVLLCIFILGGDAIRSFTFAMIFGVIIGTLATIFVAAPVAYITDSRRNKAKKPAK